VLLKYKIMAGTKRHTDGSDSTRVKKTKIQPSSQHQKPVNTVKASDVKQSALPSPEDSSTASGDNEESSFNEARVDQTFASKEKVPPLNSKTKISAPVQGGEGFVNGEHLRQTAA
jgi:hypothetical protein